MNINSPHFLSLALTVGIIVATFVYEFTKKIELAKFGFIFGTAGNFVIFLILIMRIESINSLFLLSAFMTSAAVTLIIIAVPLILLSRQKSNEGGTVMANEDIQ